MRDDCGYMPIHIAAQFDSIEMFKRLDNLKIGDFNKLLSKFISKKEIEFIEKMKMMNNYTIDGDNTLDLMIKGNAIKCLKAVVYQKNKLQKNKWNAYVFGKREIFLAKESESWGALQIIVGDLLLVNENDITKMDWIDLKKRLAKVEYSQWSFKEWKSMNSLTHLVDAHLELLENKGL
ncbi:MAG: hypothetical protein GY714_14090 [Desulfobacterales bacterium]|nr:hypothetical protein [Desulfobacterales bacterium]